MRPWWMFVVTGCALDVGDPVLPAAGVWDYRDGGLVHSTCPDDLYRDPDASFVLTNVSTEGFTIVEEESFDCTLDGSTFTCPERRRIEVPVGETVLTWTVSVAGRFDGPRSLEGEQTFEVSCTGGFCDLDELLLGVSLPCVYVVAFSASR